MNISTKEIDRKVDETEGKARILTGWQLRLDAVIAFSVIYKGFENLDGFKKWFSKDPPNLLIMVFIFGLIHGFGLSTKLQEIAVFN